MERRDNVDRSRVSERSERWTSCTPWTHDEGKYVFFNEMNTSLKKVNTGGRFRSYVLWVVSHNHHQIVPQVVERVEDGV